MQISKVHKSPNIVDLQLTSDDPRTQVDMPNYLFVVLKWK